jgi:hypothetical protein
VRRGGDDRIIRASRAIEHPGRNLKPPSRIGAAQRAAENNIIRLGDRLVDEDRQTKPWMPPIQELAKTGPVGVIKLGCTTAFEHIVHWMKMRQSLARFSVPESSPQIRSLADFIVTTSEFKFSAQDCLAGSHDQFC